MKKTFCELFAGVGGFRIGLEASNWECVFSNQYEPSTKKQHASEVYTARFGDEGHTNCDIANLDVNDIPDHTMLVGGFPCQDYSVAKPLPHSKGIQGKKGVLWWEIFRIIQAKRPPFVLLENVNRLISSPTHARGRDFAIILSCFEWLGYAVEWRVVNAADYGFPQRRKRVFILAYQVKDAGLMGHPTMINGILAQAFPAGVGQAWPSYFIGTELRGGEGMASPNIAEHIHAVSETWEKMAHKTSPFKDAGAFYSGVMFTGKATPNYVGHKQVLRNILQDDGDVDESFLLGSVKDYDKAFERWWYLKGAKNEPRQHANGHTYTYNEGAVTFPDDLDKPSRTIITSEGGTAPSRFKHVVASPEWGYYRRLTPIELERLNGFPDDWTNIPSVSDTKRAFLMGNALVTGVVERIGKTISSVGEDYIVTKEIQESNDVSFAHI